MSTRISKRLRISALLLVAPALVAGVGAIAVGRSCSHATPQDGSAATPPALARVGFPVGMAQRYAFESRSQDASDLSAVSLPTAEASIDLAGELEVRSYAPDLVGVRVLRLDRHRYALGKNDLLGEKVVGDEVLEREVLAHVVDGGWPDRLLVDPGASPALRLVAQHVLIALGIRVPAGARNAWDAAELGFGGSGPVHYALEQGHSTSLSRTRTAYAKVSGLPELLGEPTQQLASRDTIELRADGAPEEIHRSETLAADVAAGEKKATFRHASTVNVRWLGQRPLREASPDLAPFRTVALGEALGSADARADLDRRAGEAMTEAQFDALLAHVARGDALTADMRHTTASWIRQHHGIADRIAEVLERPALALRSRIALLDLLVECGSNDAQEALVAALGSKTFRTPKLWNLAMGRVVLVRKPSDEYLGFLRDSYVGFRNAGAAPAAGVTAVAYGAALGTASRSGRASELTNATAMLRKDLEAAGASEDKRALLSALGNAGLRADSQAIARYTRDSDPTVRQMAVHALRYNAAENAEPLLVALTDGSASVVRTAMGVIASVELTTAQARSLVDAAMQGTFNADVDDALAGYVVKSPALRPYAGSVLAALLAREGGNPTTAAHLRDLLQRLSG